MTSTASPGPAALRALAHPVRLRILGLLRADGPATATSLAARLGINSGATSYHLRQLGQHGFIEEDLDRGTARERWWRAAHQATSTQATDDSTPEGREALEAMSRAVAVLHTELLHRAVDERPLLPQRWRDAFSLNDWTLRVTPARARALREALSALVLDWEEQDPDDAEAAEFTVVLQTYPFPGRLGEEPR